MAEDQNKIARAKALRAKMLRAKMSGAAASPTQAEQAPSPLPAEPTGAEQAQAALQGFGQGATLGYIPKLQAITQPAMDWALEKAASTEIGSKVLGVPQGATVDSGTYEQRVQEAKARDVALAEKAPGSYAAGTVGGVLSTIPAITATATKAGLAGATTGLGKVAQAGTVGATLGAAQEAEGEFGSKENLMNRLKGAGIGGALGGAGQAVAQGVQAVPRVLEKAQTLAALKGIGANTGQLKQLLKKKMTGPLSEFVKKQGLLKIGGGVDDVLEKTTSLADETGDEIGKIYDDLMVKGQNVQLAPDVADEFLKSKALLRPQQMADDFLVMAEKELKGVSGGQQALGAIKSELDNVVAMGDDAGIKELLKYRQSLDDTLNWNKTFSESKVNQQALKRLRSFVQDRIDNHFKVIEKAAGTEDKLVKRLKDLKDTYGKSLKVKDISQNAVAREMAKMPIGLPEIGVGGAYGVATGDPVQGLLAAGAMKGIRYLGPAVGVSALGAARGAANIPAYLSRAATPSSSGAAAQIPWMLMREKNGNN